jgi:hypothetical protein
VSAGVTLAFANEAMVDVFPVTQYVPILDHTVGEKTVQETCHDEINSMPTITPQNAMDSCHSQLSLENQVTVNGDMQRLVDPVKNASHHHGGDGLKDDDQGCSNLLPDQDQIQRDVDLSCSTSRLHQLVEDLLFLAVDPSYGIERGCDSSICY